MHTFLRAHVIVVAIAIATLSCACARSSASPRAAVPNPTCADPGDPNEAVHIDSITSGASGVRVHFYRSATGMPLDAVNFGVRVLQRRAHADSLGHLALSVPEEGTFLFQSRRLDYKPRDDSILVRQNSVTWVRLGMARSLVDARACRGDLTIGVRAVIAPSNFRRGGLPS